MCAGVDRHVYRIDLWPTFNWDRSIPRPSPHPSQDLRPQRAATTARQGSLASVGVRISVHTREMASRRAAALVTCNGLIEHRTKTEW